MLPPSPLQYLKICGSVFAITVNQSTAVQVWINNFTTSQWLYRKLHKSLREKFVKSDSPLICSWYQKSAAGLVVNCFWFTVLLINADLMVYGSFNIHQWPLLNLICSMDCNQLLAMIYQHDRALSWSEKILRYRIKSLKLTPNERQQDFWMFVRV